jgi:hypothetical protein
MSHREHPRPDDLLRFLLGEASRAEAREIVRHLLTGCPQCLQVTRPLWRFGDEARLKISGAGAPAGAGPDGVPANPETRV